MKKQRKPGRPRKKKGTKDTQAFIDAIPQLADALEDGILARQLYGKTHEPSTRAVLKAIGFCLVYVADHIEEPTKKK